MFDKAVIQLQKAKSCLIFSALLTLTQYSYVLWPWCNGGKIWCWPEVQLRLTPDLSSIIFSMGLQIEDGCLPDCVHHSVVKCLREDDLVPLTPVHREVSCWRHINNITLQGIRLALYQRACLTQLRYQHTVRHFCKKKKENTEMHNTKRNIKQNSRQFSDGVGNLL